MQTLLLRCTIDINQESMLDADPTNNAILLKNEKVNAALEFAPLKIIVAVDKVDLLVISEWKNIQVIKDPFPAN